MRRKVIQIADSTQLVSLPRKWALKYGIKKGDELEVEESNSDLLVSLPSKKSPEKKLELNILTAKDFLRRFLFSPYIQGYTEIKVTYNDPEVFDLVSEEVNLLMGYEIITQGSNYCVIKRVATALDKDLDNIIERIFISTISMFEDLIRAMSKNEHEKLENIKSLEITNNKLSYFSLRILNVQGYKDPNKKNSIYYTILEIEQIVDDLRDICKYLYHSKINATKKSIFLMNECLDQFRFIFNLFNKFETKKLSEFNQGIKKLSSEIIQALEKQPKDAVILAFLYSILIKISHISKEIHY